MVVPVQICNPRRDPFTYAREDPRRAPQGLPLSNVVLDHLKYREWAHGPGVVVWLRVEGPGASPSPVPRGVPLGARPPLCWTAPLPLPPWGPVPRPVPRPTL